MTLYLPDGRPVPSAKKAVTGPGVASYATGTVLSSLQDSPQNRAAKCLAAYKVGWFYKAGHKITSDLAALDWSVSDGDIESEDPAETIIDRPDLSIPFRDLNPIEQLIRLMERPNPYQTGRQLRQKTHIRRDFAGLGIWYLENGDFGLPTAIYGISPARMWPSRNAQGVLIGWVMDRDRPGGGIPFSAREIMTFSTASADDDDLFGASVVEAVYAELPLTDLMARHTTDLLTTGGRLAGMVWSKERSLDEGEFEDVKRAWRNVASDPNAARRLLIFPEPMEYAAGASTPAEIGIPELAALNRDNILTAFPISPYQLGVPVPGGLNSGETRVQDRRDYWEGTIHPRVVAFDEAINVELVSRYEAVMGRSFIYRTEEPNLDDPASIIERVKALDALVQSGADSKAARKAAGLDHIKFATEPQRQPTPAELMATNPQPQPDLPMGPVKSAQAHWEAVVPSATMRARSALSGFFSGQMERVAGRLREQLRERKKSDRSAIKDSDWWDASAEDAALREVMRGIYIEVGRGGLTGVADALDRIVFPKAIAPIVEDLLRYGGSRIKDINDRTLQALVLELAEGTRRGYSVAQLIDGVPAEGFSGVLGVTLDNGVAVFGDARAETIARTETALSYNRATVLGYKEFGVSHLLAYDGDGDEECAARDGQEFTIDEAEAIEDHPNGTLVWSPVFDKAEKAPAPDPTVVVLLEAIKSMAGVRPAMREIVDFDEHGRVIGSHEEPLDG